MIKRSSVLGGGSVASLPIGSHAVMSHGAPIVKTGDNSEWLKTGILASAETYPAAAAIESLAAHSLTSRGSGGLVVSLDVKAVATNGTGTYIAVHGNSPSVSRSTDGGVTWTTVATGVESLPAGGSPVLTSVVWDGNSFTVTGDNGSNFISATSTAGAAGTWATREVLGNLSNSAYSPGTNITTWSGTRYYSVFSGNYPWLYVSADGAAWNRVSQVPAGLSYSDAINGIASNGSTLVISSPSGLYVSADMGVTWTAITPANIHPDATSIYVVGYVGGKYVFVTSTGLVLSTSTPATGPFAVVGLSANSLLKSQGFLSNDRTMLLALGATTADQANLWTTTDGVNWKMRSTDGLLVNSNTYARIAYNASNMVIAYASNNGLVGARPFAGSTSPLGSPNAVGRLPVSQVGNSTVYVKVK